MFDRSSWHLAWRGLYRHRRANAALVAMLALLAGVLLAVLSLGHNLLLSPWTYDTERLGVLRHGVAGSAQESYGFAPDEYRALAATGIFEQLSAGQGRAVAFGDGSAAARSLTLVHATPDALDVTDARPQLGRFVQAEDVGTSRVAISHDLWQSDFGGRTDVLGEALLLDGETYRIVGVMPPRFHFLGGDFWSAHSVDPAVDEATDARLVLNFKLRPGMTVEDARPRLDAALATFPRNRDAARYPRGWRITPLRVIDAVTGPQRPAVFLAAAGALALLLLGVLNVAALLVARQLADAGLIATRQALGESRARGIGVAFAESLLLAAASMLLALGLGRLLFDRFVSMVALEWVPRELEGYFTYATPALWTLPLAVLMIAALLTALRLPGLLRIDARAVVAGSPRSGGRQRDASAGRWLSALQIAIATCILVSSLAIGAGAQALAKRDLGYDTASTQHAVLVFPRQRYEGVARRIAVMDRMAAALQRDAGAVSVGFTDSAPLQRYTRSGAITAWSGPALDQPLAVDYHAAHGDLSAALGLRLREGRFIDARDRAQGEPVAVVTKALAERVAPGGSALGALVTVASGSETPVARRIVGVVDDVRHESPLAAARPTLYLPYAQDASANAAGGQVAIVVRYGAASPDAGRFNAALGSVDPWIAVRDLSTLQDRALRTVAGVTLARALFGGFALLGVALATLGIGAVAALSVARQRHELAVRSAIGATPRRLLSSVLAGSARIALPASLAGAALAWLLVNALQAAVQDSALLTASHLAIAPALLLTCALAATLLPARQATRVQPQALLQGR
jgi:predicted permease